LNNINKFPSTNGNSTIKWYDCWVDQLPRKNKIAVLFYSQISTKWKKIWNLFKWKKVDFTDFLDVFFYLS